MSNLSVARRLTVLTLLAAALACGDDNGETQDDRHPTAVIDAPDGSLTWAAGDEIEFSGHATDPEDGSLPGTALTWWAELHHDTHSHPFMAEQSGTEGSVTLPRTGELSDNVWYRFYLRAVDAAGQADTTYVEIYPRKASLTVTATGTGREITLDGVPHQAPYTVVSVVGMQRVLGAPSPQVALDSTWTFTGWSDGGAQNHTIVMPEDDTTFTATFTGTGPGNTPPTVTLTGPSADTTMTVNTAVTLTATAGDVDGTVLAVDFRDGTTILGTDSTAPYSFTWTPTTNGVRSINARATDDDGSSTVSASRQVTVTGGGGGDNQAPTVAWTVPAEGATGLTGSITLTATATDNVGVSAVEFRLDGAALGEDTSSPYSFTFPSTTPYVYGSHFFQVRSRDAAGNVSPWATRHVTFGGDNELGDDFVRTTLAGGNLGGQATAMTFAPDGRLFVCQQNGQLRVYKNGTLLATPFLSVAVNSVSERGLLGVAFDPDYATNRYLYVYYTTSTAPIHNRVSRFTASAGNPDVVQAGSELPILDLPTLDAGNHNGGAIHFGPDGKLYVAVGDNAVGSNAQSLTTRFGKMLRINPDGSIPTDNPFYGTTTGDNRAIWALGLRNPFTFAFQPGTGRMHINDVGEGTWEEINRGQAGANYGWPTTEGATTNPNFTTPIFAYRHNNSGPNPSLMTGFAITGGAFYNPSTVLFPAHYVGSYFFSDVESGWIGRLDLETNEAHHFARSSITVDLAVGPDGALYALSYTGGGWGVFRYAPQ